MGLTLVSISHIASAGFSMTFRLNSMRIFGPRNSQLGHITVQGSLYTTYEATGQTQRGTHIKKLHTDQGGEYLSAKFDNHLAKIRMLHNLIVHDTPKHNGVSKRLNCTLLEKVRAMLHSSGLPKYL